jgi:hypothetical protein
VKLAKSRKPKSMFSLICGVQTYYKYRNIMKTGYTKEMNGERQKKEVKKVNMADLFSIQKLIWYF